MTKAMALAAVLAAAFAPPLADAQDFEDRHILPNVFEDGLSNIEGFIRIHNHSLERAPVKLSAYDDAGVFWGDRTIFLDSTGATHFNSGDLENGNPDKGLEGFGNASNHNQVSILRAKNMEDYEQQCLLLGFDDGNVLEGTGFNGLFTLGAGEGAEYTAQELEDLIGDGGGKWYFLIFCDRILVSSLLHSRPTGYITNLTNAAVESPALRDFTPSKLERIRQAFANSKAVEIQPSPSPILH